MSSRLPSLACLAIAALAFGCPKSQAEPWQIGRIQILESAELGSSALGLSQDELLRETHAAFQGTGRFVVAKDDKKASPRLYGCRLGVAITGESAAESKGEEHHAEIGVVLELRQPGEAERLQATGLGHARYRATEASARSAALRQALKEALAQAVEAQTLQLAAFDRTDAALIADLGSKDARVRDYAVRVLADRKNAAAVPALMERLGDSDREVALRAVGALGAIGDPRAVPALIEMTRNRDEDFVRSIVEVIGSIGGTDAQAWLFTIASGHPDESVRAAAQEAQSRLAERTRAGPSPATPVVPEPPASSPPAPTK